MEKPTMPSMRCHECHEVRRCTMRLARNEQDKLTPIYFCARDAREWDKDHEKAPDAQVQEELGEGPDDAEEKAALDTDEEATWRDSGVDGNNRKRRQWELSQIPTNAELDAVARHVSNA